MLFRGHVLELYYPILVIIFYILLYGIGISFLKYRNKNRYAALDLLSRFLHNEQPENNYNNNNKFLLKIKTKYVYINSVLYNLSPFLFIIYYGYC